MESLKNIFAVADLRKRVLFTLGLLAVYRVGGHIPTPGINKDALAALVDQAKGTMFGLYDMEEVKGRGIPEWLSFDVGQMSGRVASLPTRAQINLPVQEQLIVELYSK